MKTKAAKIFSDYKYGIVIFAVLAVQAIINLIPIVPVGEYLYVYYLVDFSMGSASRLLIGSIINLITDTPTIEWVTRLTVVFVFITLLVSAFLAGKVISSVKKELRLHIFIFTLFLVSGPFAFANFSRYTGFFYPYMFILSLVAIVFLFNK